MCGVLYIYSCSSRSRSLPSLLPAPHPLRIGRRRRDAAGGNYSYWGGPMAFRSHSWSGWYGTMPRKHDDGITCMRPLLSQ